MFLFGGIPVGRGAVYSKSWAGNRGVALLVYFMPGQGMPNPNVLYTD